MDRREPISCGDFFASVRRDGCAYGDTWYVVSAVVASLTEAQSRADAIREAVQRERPTWRATSDEIRLKSSDWSGNPVRIELSYIHSDRED